MTTDETSTLPLILSLYKQTKKPSLRMTNRRDQGRVFHRRDVGTGVLSEMRLVVIVSTRSPRPRRRGSPGVLRYRRRPSIRFLDEEGERSRLVSKTLEEVGSSFYPLRPERVRDGGSGVLTPHSLTRPDTTSGPDPLPRSFCPGRAPLPVRHVGVYHR